MRILMTAMFVLLAGCTTTEPKTNPPPAALIQVPVATYVPITSDLTKRCTWTRDATPSAVFSVSNGRKRCLLQYEAQFDAIDGVQGKPVPDPTK